MSWLFRPKFNWIDLLTVGAFVHFWDTGQSGWFLVALYALLEIVSTYGEYAYFGTVNGKVRGKKGIRK